MKRRRQKWTYDYDAVDRDRARLTTAEFWSGKHGRCGMVSPTGKRCVGHVMHRGRHTTVESK